VIVHQLTQGGAEIMEDDIAVLSFFLTGGIQHFGDYLIDMRRMPKIIGASKTLDFVRWQ
jgi:hypothetical protein